MILWPLPNTSYVKIQIEYKQMTSNKPKFSYYLIAISIGGKTQMEESLLYYLIANIKDESQESIQNQKPTPLNSCCYHISKRAYRRTFIKICKKRDTKCPKLTKIKNLQSTFWRYVALEI